MLRRSHAAALRQATRLRENALLRLVSSAFPGLTTPSRSSQPHDAVLPTLQRAALADRVCCFSRVL